MRHAEAAIALLKFARTAAEHRLLVLRGSPSTSVPLAYGESLVVTGPLGRTVLVGEGEDAAYADDEREVTVTAALASGNCRIEVAGQVFPVTADSAVTRLNQDAIVIESRQPRHTGRMVLVVDRESGLHVRG